MSTSKETFAEFLRRCGTDQEESGRTATAEDYFSAANKIETMAAALRHAQTALAAVGSGSPIAKHSLSVIRDALKVSQS